MRVYVPVADQVEVAFDLTNPHVGMPDGQLILSGPSKETVTVPFALVGDGVFPSKEVIADRVNNALNEERWLFNVTEVRVGK